MNGAIYDLLAELAALGAVERRPVAGSVLIYAEPCREGAPPVEFLLSPADEIAYVAVSNVVELEFDGSAADQERAVGILDLVIDSGMTEFWIGSHHGIRFGGSQMHEPEPGPREEKAWPGWRLESVKDLESISVRIG